MSALSDLSSSGYVLDHYSYALPSYHELSKKQQELLSKWFDLVVFEDRRLGF